MLKNTCTVQNTNCSKIFASYGGLYWQYMLWFLPLDSTVLTAKGKQMYD